MLGERVDGRSQYDGRDTKQYQRYDIVLAPSDR
jgi:hypothetical protein